MLVRLIVIPIGLALAGVVWLISTLFPSVNPSTVALVLAFGLAGGFVLFFGGRAKRVKR